MSDGSHTFAVRATDAAGNTGAAATRSWTVAEPPTIPGDLQAAAPSGGQVDLQWTPSSDNVGVTDYLVYRDGGSTPLATVASGTSYSDLTVAPTTTYAYVVQARDAAGLVSGASATATITTPAGGPPPPPPPPPPTDARP